VENKETQTEPVMNGLVEAINGAAERWWSYIAPAAWQAALVGLLLLAVATIGRRWPSPVRFAILALALAKFAIPPLAAVPSGLFSQFTAATPQPAEPVAVAVAEPPSLAPSAIPSSRRAAMPTDVSEMRMPIEPPIARPATAAVPPEAPIQAAAAPVPAAEPVRAVLGVKGWLMLAHLAGVGAMLGLIAIQFRRVLRTTQSAERVIEGPLFEQFTSLCERLGLRRRPRLLLAASGDQPFSCGTLRASVVLPEPLAHRLSIEQLQAALAHELAHHRRSDLWLNWLQVLLCAAWWFHPVVWMLNRALRAAREDCCDDLLLAKSLVGNDAYCRTLLQVAAAPIRASRSPLTLTMSDSPHPLGRRFRRIMDSTLRRWPKLPLSAMLALAIAAAVLLPGLRRASVAADPDREQTDLQSVAGVAQEPPTPTATNKPQSPSESSNRPKPAKLTLHGEVVDGNEKPVAGATVALLAFDGKHATAQSDANGDFELRTDRREVTDTTLVASTADGANLGFFEYSGNPEAYNRRQPTRLVMKPAKSIDVRVVDASGRPVADAVVGVVVSYRGIASGRSNTEGKCALRVPANAPLQNIYAFKSGKGLDYVVFPTVAPAATNDGPQPPDLSRPVTLQLSGARTIRIMLVDPEGKPIKGVGVTPWIFQKPQWSHGNDLNICGVADFHVDTDAAGVATFDWIPTWDKETPIFWTLDLDRWTSPRIEWDAATDTAVKVVQLQRRVPVRGRVRHADGRPVAGASVDAQCNVASDEGAPRQTSTDDQGRFEIRVAPGGAYTFALTDNRWAAPPATGVDVQPDKPVKDVEIRLFKSATRLHGQLTVGPDKKPWAGQGVSMTPLGSQGERIEPFVNRWATTDADGRYSFAVGPGEYKVSATASGVEQHVSVTDQKDVICNLHSKRELLGIITVRVVDQSNPPQPMPYAKVVGTSISSMCHGDLEATTNDKGWFRIQRALDKMQVSARSKDGRMVGDATIGPDDAEVTIPLQPAGAVKGQAVDAATGLVARKRTIRYEVYYHYELPNNNSGIGSSRLVGSVKTDEAGRFAITGLVPGLEYTLSVPKSEKPDKTRMPQYDSLCKVVVSSGETKELGAVGFRREMMPNEAIVVALANRDPVDGRLVEWANEANRRKQRTLIMFWTSEPSNRLQEIIGDGNKRFKDYYVISSQVDKEKLDVARIAYAKKWDLKSSDEPWPIFCVLDVSGKVLLVKDTLDFAKAGMVDQSLVEEFWQANKLPPSNPDVPKPPAVPPLKKTSATTLTSAPVDAAAPAERPQKQAATTPIDGVPLLTASGRAVDPTGKPVAGATVYLREWSTYRISSEPYNQNLNDILATTKTDAAGAFRFDRVPSKKMHDQWMAYNPWDVVVVAEPYAIAWQHLTTPASDKPHEFRLSEAAKISGRITDAQGHPVRDAVVKVHAIYALAAESYPPIEDPETFDLQLSRLRPAGEGDANGDVTIGGLPRDVMISLEIRHPDHHSKFLRVATNKEPQPDMDMPKYEGGKRVPNPQKVFSMNFTATLDPPAPRIVGRLVAADTKKPLAGAIVIELQGLDAITDADGRFTFDEVDRSPCRVLARAPLGGDYLSRFVNITPAKDKRDTQVELELPRGEIVSGVVVDAETHKGVANVNVWFDTGLDVNTAKVDGLMASFCTTGADGRFRVAAPTGKGKLKIAGPVAGYDLPRSTYTPPGQEEDDDPDFVKRLEVTAGKPIADVKFAVSRGRPTAGTPAASARRRAGTQMVEGVVIDPNGAPVPDAEVGTRFSLLNAPSRGDKPFRIDKDGRFAFRIREYQLPELIVVKHEERKLCGRASLGEDAAKNAKMPMTIRLKPTGTVTGRVTDGDKPLAGIGVQLIAERVPGSPREGGYSADYAKTDAEGVFRFPLVEADTEFSVCVFDERYTNTEMRSDRVRVAAGGTFEVKPFAMIRLDKSVSGIVVDPDGKPVAGALVSADLQSGGNIPRAFLQHPTRSDGKFVIRGVPNLPLRLTAYMQAAANPNGGRIYFPAHVDAEPGQTDVRILLDPKLVRKKK
jgi:beta-lactamase regulating signal transducer with metallopeptidase domain/protocatechuate 3,4-dioxygenase beta subunit